MNEQEQRIAIAEACGWDVPEWCCHEENECYMECSEFYNESIEKLPDCLNDLNAMHEAAMCQSGDFLIQYRNTLADIAGAQHYHNATAAQRAEAFLKTLNLWK